MRDTCLLGRSGARTSGTSDLRLVAVERAFRCRLTNLVSASVSDSKLTSKEGIRTWLPRGLAQELAPRLAPGAGAGAGAKKGSSKQPKTQLSSASVPAFLARLAADRVADAKAIVRMMEKATGKKAALWGDAIVGCDTYTVKYADGRELPWPLVAMSPRKSAFVLYIGWRKHADLLATIGKHKTAGGCIHIKSLADVDAAALQRLITAAARSRKSAAD